MPSYESSLFNVDPYYDDFSEDKKFLRLMFRPGYGVQARELTQVQTLLQNQIERFGSHVFDEGSMVLDGQVMENRVKYARVSTNTADPTDFVGVVMGLPNRASARVVHAEGGLGITSDNNTVLFFDYIEGGSGFQFNDVLAGTAANGAGITATVTGPASFVTAVGDGIVVSVDRGVRFVNGYFVLNTAQSIGAYSLSGSGASQVRIFDNPTTRIGFDVTKQFVTATDDESLNDPAFGYYNYAAPGSDRFVIDLDLKQYGYTASNTSAIDNFSREGFIEFMRVVDGEVVKVEKYPDYAALEDTLARRTYDESGNYTVRRFPLELNGPTSVDGTQVLKAELSPSKAYIFGYEFETQGRSKLNIRCARGADHERVVTRDFVRYVGPSTKVTFSGISGSVGVTTDFGNHPFAFLSSGESGTAFSSLGTARLRGVEPYSGSVFDLGIYDINMATGNFSSVRRIYIGQTANHAFMLTGSAGLEDQSQSSLLYRVPEGSAVKSFGAGDFAVVAHNKQVASALPYTFTITETTTNLAVLPSTGTVSLPNADVVVFDQDGNVCGGTAARGTSNQQLSITINSGTTSGKQLHVISSREPINDTLSMVQGANGFVRAKTSTLANISLTGAWASLTGDERGTTSDTLYLNGYVDVLEVLALTGSRGASSGISLLPFFQFDNGQRDALYDWSRMVLTPGVTGITGPYTATVRHFARSGYGFYTVASYSDYESIPTYKSRTTGEEYSLRDCIDFRPDRSLSGDTVINPTWIPANTSANDNTYTYTHYLPRTDRITLTRDRRFSLIEGTPSVNGDIPRNDPNAMTLYTVRVNPYTFSSDDVTIGFVENKRYTMRDIGELEMRIENLEYNSTLNRLEQDAKAQSVRDDTGEEMPKKGILVDLFKGHAVADTGDPMFFASIDPENNEVRPIGDIRSYGLDFVSAISVTGNTADGLYTLSYTQSPEISNLLASNWVYINPFVVMNFMGSMTISPSTDNWFAPEKLPVVEKNDQGENDNFEIKQDVLEWNFNKGQWVSVTDPNYWLLKADVRLRTWGSRWNSWESLWFGRGWGVLSDITAWKRTPGASNPDSPWEGNYAKFYSGAWSPYRVVETKVPATPKEIAGDKVVEKDVTPRGRAKPIAIKAKGLKPNAPFRVYCDDFDVSPFCTGGSLETDYRGEVNNLTFLFNTPVAAGAGYSGPAQDFLVGTHRIRIADNPVRELCTMAAETTYTIQGAVATTNPAEMLTRPMEVVTAKVDSSTVVSNLGDLNRNANDISGYPDPLSQTFYVDPVKYPNGAFLKSVDLYFKTNEPMNTIPVTLQVRPTLNGYPHPSNVLPFGTSVVYSNSVNTDDLITDGNSNYTNFPFTSPIYLTPGQEYAICVWTNSPNYSVFTGVVGSEILRADEQGARINVTKQPLVRSLFKPQNTGNVVKTTKESLAFRLNFCKFVSSGTITMQNDAITDENPQLNINYFRINTQGSLPENTSILYAATVSDIAHGGAAATYSKITPNTNTPASQGYHQINSSLGVGDVASVTATLARGSDLFISPVLDVERSSFLAITNVINNNSNTTRGDALYNGELDPNNEASANKALCRYISKRVTLEPGVEAENLTVVLSLSNARGWSSIKPTIKVFARPVPLEETDIDLVDYIELATTDTGESLTENDFRDVTYTNIGLAALPKFSTFSIKVVMFGDPTGASFPKIRNLRIIAT